MIAPPPQLDGADVLLWTASLGRPYYHIPEGDFSIPIRAMAICRYAGPGAVYLFKCNFTECGEWDVVHDQDCQTVEEAKDAAIACAGSTPLKWQTA